MSDVRSQVQDIFRDVFDDPTLELRDDMTADDVDDWDSLSHINLIIAIERAAHQVCHRRNLETERAGRERRLVPQAHRHQSRLGGVSHVVGFVRLSGDLRTRDDLLPPAARPLAAAGAARRLNLVFLAPLLQDKSGNTGFAEAFQQPNWPNWLGMATFILGTFLLVRLVRFIRRARSWRSA